MNVLHIICVFPPEHAPAGVNAQELAEDLANRGHKAMVLTGWPSHPKGTIYPGWKAHFRHIEKTPQGFFLLRSGHSLHVRESILWKMWYYFTFAVSTFINGLGVGRVDVVLCESAPLFGSFTALLLAKIKRARFLYKIHDVHPETALNAGLLSEGVAYRLLRAWDTMICRNSSVVATLSETMRRTLLERGLPEDHVIIARHWLDGNKLCPGDRDNSWSRSNNIPLDKFIVLHAGTIGYLSGAKVIIRAAEKLKDRPDILILMVGDGPLKQPCQDLTEELGLSNVRFLPFQPAEVLPDMQRTGDVGLVTLLPDSGESSIPSKTLGYIATGRAVIASVREDTPTAQMIRDAKMGIVTSCQDPQALAQAILRTADDRKMLQRMGENAREFFLREYDRAVLTDLHEELLAGSDPRVQG